MKDKKTRHYPALKILFSFPIFFLLSGCVLVDGVARRTVKGILESSFSSFYAEEDLTLAREASASNLKLLEGLCTRYPKDTSLQVLCAKAFFSYSFGYVEEENPERASKLYYRGFLSAAKAIGGEEAFTRMNFDDFKIRSQKEFKRRFESYFWAALNFAAWVNLNKSDPVALTHRGKIEWIGTLCAKQNEGYYHGGAHLLLGLYFSAMPKTLGGTPEKGREHFEKALLLSEKSFLPVQYFYARYYATAVQNKKLFDTLLTDCRDFKPESCPSERLVNTLIRERAQKLLESADQYFISDN